MRPLTRRTFLAATAAALGCSSGGPGPEGGSDYLGPVLDVHQHAGYSGRTDDQLVSHQIQIGVTSTVVLPGAGWMLESVAGNEACAALGQRYDHPFIRFGNADPAAADAVATLMATLEEWAVGIGEQKFPVAVDSPEMRRVYDVARERKVPVLLHFEHEKYNLGIENLPKILEAYPEVSFIGHAQTWWANLSANPDPSDMYPQGPVTPGGLVDRWLADYPNIYADLSANSGLNALTRDEAFTRGFLERHNTKLIWGSDCNCHDGKGAGREDGRCLGASCLAALRRLAPSQSVLAAILYGNGARVLGLAEC
jgi:predicted TIM-barrel fold metal-dependent hydrolase